MSFAVAPRLTNPGLQVPATGVGGCVGGDGGAGGCVVAVVTGVTGTGVGAVVVGATGAGAGDGAGAGGVCVGVMAVTSAPEALNSARCEIATPHVDTFDVRQFRMDRSSVEFGFAPAISSVAEPLLPFTVFVTALPLVPFQPTRK